MNTHDLLPFTKMLVELGELYGKAISELLTELYWQALEQFDLQDISQAFQAHIHNPDSGQYFPKPADVVRFIEGTGETRALQAWSKVEYCMSRVGSYQSIAFDDAIIHAVLADMGGWSRLCTVRFEELAFRANEFCKRYMGYVNKPPQRYPKYLHGIFEAVNAKNGHPISPPLLIGDTEKAAQVMLGGSNHSIKVFRLDSTVTEIETLVNIPIQPQMEHKP